MADAVGRTWMVYDKPGVELYHVELTFRVRASEDDGGYVAVCEELGVPSEGETVGEALENVVDATLLYLNTIEEIDERRRVFDEHEITCELGLPEVASAATRATHVDVDIFETVSRRVAALA